MSTYEERQEARRTRLEDRAAKKSNEAESLYGKASSMQSVIPFGQPILVGHYSEGRDRRYRNRIHDTYGRSFKAMDEAKQLERRAESVGTAGIASDDENAIAKLEAELEAMQKQRESFKKINAAIRRAKGNSDKAVEFLSEFVTHERAWTLVHGGRVWMDGSREQGIPAYRLANLGSEIRRVTKRIEDLRRLATKDELLLSGTVEGIAWEISEGDGRYILMFDSRTSKEVFDVVRKQLAMVWSPSLKAFVRKVTPNARASIEYLAPRVLVDTEVSS